MVEPTGVWKVDGARFRSLQVNAEASVHSHSPSHLFFCGDNRLRASLGGSPVLCSRHRGMPTGGSSGSGGDSRERAQPRDAQGSVRL